MTLAPSSPVALLVWSTLVVPASSWAGWWAGACTWLAPEPVR